MSTDLPRYGSRPECTLGSAPRSLGGTAVGWRALDIVLGTLALAVALPLLLVIAVAIRFDTPGPVLFRQRRVGRGRHTFVVFKFRTMRPNADESVHRQYVGRLIGGADERVTDGKRSLYKLAGDDRITRVGRVLRRTSLDELPQLLNVIRGQMSLVGPRPVIPYEVEMYPDAYFERFHVKPGITGLWQVSGRNERSYEEMVDLDVEFVRRRSLRLYVSIIARTVWVVVLGRGAA